MRASFQSTLAHASCAFVVAATFLFFLLLSFFFTYLTITNVTADGGTNGAAFSLRAIRQIARFYYVAISKFLAD